MTTEQSEKAKLESLAQNYYAKILQGEIEEATELLKELAKLHYNYYTITNILDRG